MERIERSAGSTRSERYLARLCERTFLSLWSYPNLYTSEGRRNGLGAGKELCDLLVVFGNHIIVLSDKDVVFNSTIDIKVAWNRWRKRAIVESAKQLLGAEKWIRERPTEIYLDKLCTQRLPLEISQTEPLRIHLIAVTKNSAGPAKRYFGGNSSGSLMLIPCLSDQEITERPFTQNDYDSNRTFVHVLDELTLDILFEELDTTYDFVRYLSAKEKAIRSNQLHITPGEEDILAYYMLNGGLINDEPFVIADPNLAKEFSGISLLEGFWQDYSSSRERAQMKTANKPSYFWDALIENFAQHIRAGTVGVARDKGTATHEQAIRWLAAEGRLSRRSLSEQFLEKMHSTPSNRRSSRVCFSPFDPKACFVLVLYPRDHGENYDSYRDERIETLHAYGLACKYKFPNAERITLIGTEPQQSEGRSEDVLAIEIDELTEEERELARDIIEKDKILSDVRSVRLNTQIAPYPTELRAKHSRRTQPKIGRNEPCVCGSGKKYKHCCLRK
jgi:hypothetical protein